MTDAETQLLRNKVCELRRTLPDPSARDISEAIAEISPEMATWATPNRVKKLNTKLNREVKGKSERDGLEPDETDGPLVLDELGQWPSDTSLEDHLANDRDARIFKVSEHHKASEITCGDSGGGCSAALGFRRNLAALAKCFDQKYKLWKMCDAEETSELVLVCSGVKWWQSEKKGAAQEAQGQIRAVFELEFHQGAPRSGAHKRLMNGLLAKHAGDVGCVTATVEEQEVMMTHLRRNRYYEDKYKKGGGGGGVDNSGEAGGMLVSYVVTPAPEWFR